MAKINRSEYAAMFGPTTGDQVRQTPTYGLKLRKISHIMAMNVFMAVVRRFEMEWVCKQVLRARKAL